MYWKSPVVERKEGHDVLDVARYNLRLPGTDERRGQ